MTTDQPLEAPSFRRRALYAVALLVAFYVLMIATALVFAVPPVLIAVHALHDPGAFAHGWRGNLIIVVFCLTISGLLLGGTVAAGPPPFRPRGRLLAREDAPRLFEDVAALAQRAGVRGPDEVYLTALPEAAVTQTGGLRKGGARVLVLGLPLLDALTVLELRAVICHELGHFAGGDTRLVRLGGHAHDLFVSVVEGARGRPFADAPSGSLGLALVLGRQITEAIARAYASVYFRLSTAISRRVELAADRFAAATASRDALISALERSVELAAYEHYLETDVAQIAKRFVMPSDLLPGFSAFRARFLESAFGKAMIQRLRTEPTSDTDTHPSLTDRVRALRALPELEPSEGAGSPYRTGGTDRAMELLADPEAMEAWLALETQPIAAHASGLPTLPWAEIARRVYLPDVEQAAREVASRLHPAFPAARTIPAMFAAVVHAMETGGAAEAAALLDPAIAALSGNAAGNATATAMATALVALYRGALLERGATIVPALGAGGGPELVFEGRPILAEHVVARAFSEDDARAELSRAAERLGR
jgi:Zn-dependent protease with chaperone function